MPGVFEGDDLRFGGAPALLLEQHVVRAVGVERRVEVDQVDARVANVVAQDVKVVAVEEGVLVGG